MEQAADQEAALKRLSFSIQAPDDVLNIDVKGSFNLPSFPSALAEMNNKCA
jgi:hypothetical protein